MADQGEQAFVKTFLNTISTQPVIFADDFQPPPQDWLKKVPVLQIPLPPPPERKVASDATPASSSAKITITFKSLKPPAAYTLSVHPTDTIASIKAQLAASEPSAPPADAQRLLLKGKALADGKLLQEYPVRDGDTVNLIVKPGVDWDPTKPRATSTTTETKEAKSPEALSPGTPMDVDKNLNEEGKKLGAGPGTTRPRGHQRIPSVVLSPSPSSETSGVVEKDIILTLDSGVIPDTQPEMQSTFSITITKPEFWEGLHAFLKSEFTVEADALTAFENFFRASKGVMTASQIAKIRDQVGIMGMAGT